MVFSPDSSRIIAVLSGYRDQGFQVVDVATRQVVQTVVQSSAFLGATFSPDGQSLFVSGGNRDLVYQYLWRDNSATLVDSIALGPPPPDSTGGRDYPAGLACSPDGSRLYVVENLADSLAVVDLASRRVVQRLAVGPYPYGVIAARDGSVYVSAWGGEWVARFVSRTGALAFAARIPAGRHPSAMALDGVSHRLYVACASSDRIAVVDTRTDSVLVSISDTAPSAPGEGSTPNALTLSPDHRRLYVAEADNNAVAVFDTDVLPKATDDSSAARSLLGRIPVEWYPTAVLARGTELWVLNGKGRGTAPNPKRSQPGKKRPEDRTEYTLGQTNGSLTALQAPADGDLPALSSRVAKAMGWERSAGVAAWPPFEHVIYVIRENRTYDQVLGDLPSGDGDSTLTFFPRAVTPNAHALAERFGVFDRFFVTGEVSGDGHNWTTAAYAADYVEKTIPSAYSGRGRTYDYDGLNHDVPAEDDVNEPVNGYLWDLARQARITFRNYGEFTHRAKDGSWVANKSWLADHTDRLYPGWDLDIADTVRSARWLDQFQAQVAGDSLPALTVLWLPNDHTAGARAQSPTPRAYLAINDLALGHIVEAVSRSPYWKSTVLIVVEDDAQDGPDHVDSHRSPLLVISAYSKRGVHHSFTNTTDVVATIGRILHLGTLSQFDRFGRPLSYAFSAEPDTSPYAALASRFPLTEVNSDTTMASRLSRRLDFSQEDRANPALFNRVLWLAVKGSLPPVASAAAEPHR